MKTASVMLARAAANFDRLSSNFSSACLRSVMTSKMATKCSGLGQYTETENHMERALT